MVEAHFTEARDSEWQWHQLGHMQVCTTTQSICLVTDCDGSARVWYLWKHGTTHECHTAAANTHIYRVCFCTCFPSFFEAPQTLHSLSGFCIVAAGGISAGKWRCVSLLTLLADHPCAADHCDAELQCSQLVFSEIKEIGFRWRILYFEQYQTVIYSYV